MKGSKLIDTSLSATESGNLTGIFADDPTTNLSKRQGGCNTSEQSRLVDNGYPHQVLLHRQTNVSRCLRVAFMFGDLSRLLADTRRPHTSVGSTPVALQQPKQYQTHMHSILTCIPFNGSAGASRSPLYSESETYTCTRDKGETICLWYKMAYTAYTIKNYESTACKEGGAPELDKGDPIVLRSPN